MRGVPNGLDELRRRLVHRLDDRQPDEAVDRLARSTPPRESALGSGSLRCVRRRDSLQRIARGFATMGPRPGSSSAWPFSCGGGSSRRPPKPENAIVLHPGNRSPFGCPSTQQAIDLGAWPVVRGRLSHSPEPVSYAPPMAAPAEPAPRWQRPAAGPRSACDDGFGHMPMGCRCSAPSDQSGSPAQS
jgi:hypothetical protein